LVVLEAALAAAVAVGKTPTDEGVPRYSIMRDEAGTTRSQRPSRWAVVALAIAMSSTSRRFLLPLLEVASGPFSRTEEEGEDTDEDELVVDRGRRRRDSKQEEDDNADDAWAGPRPLGLRKEGATGNPFRMLSLYLFSVDG